MPGDGNGVSAESLALAHMLQDKINAMGLPGSKPHTVVVLPPGEMTTKRVESRGDDPNIS